MSQAGDVLIVDDEPAVASGIARLLERRGCPHRVALSSAQALAAVRAEAPGLVLLDLTLENGRSGWTVWSELEAVRPGAELRVLVHSAALSEADRAEAERRGAAGIVRKSTPPRRLVDLIVEVLEGQP